MYVNVIVRHKNIKTDPSFEIVFGFFVYLR